MSHNEPATVIINGHIWEYHTGETTSKQIYKYKDVVKSKGEVPEFASSD